MKDRIIFSSFLLITIFLAVLKSEVKAQDSIKPKTMNSLIISDGSRFVPKDFYPKFSWETTPLYFMFGDIDRLLLPEEVRFIAGKTDFICIEKSHGLKELGAAELGAKHEVEAFKKIKPEIKVLFYFNAAFAWPFTSYSKNFTPENIAKHPELKKILLINPTTGELVLRDTTTKTFCFDVLNPEFREWWGETVAKGVKESGSDGAFIDQMHGNSSRRTDDKTNDIARAMGEMMTHLKMKLGPNKILLANHGCDDNARFVYPVIDATMFENGGPPRITKENLLKEWEDMLKNAREGKISVFRIGAEVENRFSEVENKKIRDGMLEKLSKDRLEFYLAVYLIGAQPYSYFQYGWGWALSSGSLVEYPDLLKPLGAPKGAYKRTTTDGWEFTREFEHASVWVNTETRQAKITWR